MDLLNPEALAQGTKAIETISKPNVFAVVVAIGSLVGNGLLVWSLEKFVEREVTVLTQIESRLDAFEKAETERWARLYAPQPPAAAAVYRK